jgi:hypothetical protein
MVKLLKPVCFLSVVLCLFGLAQADETNMTSEELRTRGFSEDMVSVYQIQKARQEDRKPDIVQLTKKESLMHNFKNNKWSSLLTPFGANTMESEDYPREAFKKEPKNAYQTAPMGGDPNR